MKKRVNIPAETGKPNPQGKASLEFISDWQATRPVAIQPKAPHQVLADYFTSMLVLSANLRFKPVRGQQYYLYLHKGEWNLSLIAPAEWGNAPRRLFVGECELQSDMAWTINIPTCLPDAVVQALASAWDSFSERLDTGEEFASTLPVFESGLSYHSRLHASALATSLKVSMQCAGEPRQISAKSYLQASGFNGLKLLSGAS